MTSEPNEIGLNEFLTLLSNRMGKIETHHAILVGMLREILMDDNDNPRFKKIWGWLKHETNSRHRSEDRTVANSLRINTASVQIWNLTQRMDKLEALIKGKENKKGGKGGNRK